ncbi:IS3 family transposase [Simiduia sp. 21SJ11W-1]|uniref:IS3 family transposase n=1 Tax=Simiduia sp. 21SJ11W-1 TaxID=2909669 RepID=UPI00209FAAFE|nr:IS3 family transposase [Simiduia sp. 21SJ11W-1]UTA48261.1 IS3 family transposase [Simiduia sp. 21SJ11W-1]UTA48334.1 IS3 family transposase [Simiduia sp. 21SJ11W-1]
MKYELIEQHADQYDIRLMCRVLVVHPSGFYRWRDCPSSPREQRRDQITSLVRDTYEEFEAAYGAPRIARELNEQGYKCSINYIAKIMQEQRIVARNGKAFNYGGHALTMHNVADNLLWRDFTTERPNQKWVTDITYIWVENQWLYLATVMDLYSRKIIGWSFDESMTVELITEAMQMAIDARGVSPGLIVHSDRGTQYRSNEYVGYLERHGIKRSMSRKGNCWDNAVMESFYARLKVELIYAKNYQSIEAARSGIFSYIEIFYNRKRRHSANDGVSPVEFEERAAIAA